MNQNDIAKLGYLTAFQAFQQQITDVLVPYMQQQQLLAKMMSPDIELASVGYRIPTPSRIVIAGCGGTGGWFIPKLVKIVNECITKFLISAPFEILLIDADIVETKNLLRQNFVSSDIDTNKAEVMCNRYAPHLVQGATMHYLDQYISSADIISEMNPAVQHRFVDIEQIINKRAFTLFFSFIDNAVSRQIIHRYATTNSQLFVFDVANNQYNGQLTFSNYPIKSAWMSHYPDNGTDSIHDLVANLRPFFDVGPSSFMVRYPHHITDTEYVKLHNCADEDMNAVSQLFNANDTAASLAATVLTNCLEKGYMKYSNYAFFTGENASLVASNPIVRPVNTTQIGYLYQLIQDKPEFKNLISSFTAANKDHSMFTGSSSSATYLHDVLTSSINEYINEIKTKGTT
jgi:hypothetical protein